MTDVLEMVLKKGDQRTISAVLEAYEDLIKLVRHAQVRISSVSLKAVGP